MKELPIIFSPESVRGILEGRKTQTRRVAKNIPEDCSTITPCKGVPGCFYVDCKRSECGDILCRYGQPGDRLWVRERHALWRDTSGEHPTRGVYYPGEVDERLVGKWRPSIHMPRWASRITLDILKVRVERVQDISRKDCKAEGVEVFTTHFRIPYQKLWDSINAKREGGKYAWAKNPWVWVLEFRRL